MIKKILELPNDSVSKTFIVATALCLICSIIVSSAAVGLKPLQQKNKSNDIKVNILEVAGLMEEGGDVDALFKNIEPKIVDIETGEYASDIDPNSYDQRKASKDPNKNVELDGDEDIAKIKRRAKYATVYHVKENGKTRLLILPVHGYGLWSTMYGFIALQTDANTINGIKFYEHGETPGLGGEIDNPKWRQLWPGKKIRNESGEALIEVVRGQTDPRSSAINHQIDGLAGATLTSQGVSNLMKFWLGQNGFGPYLKKFAQENS